MGLLSLRKKRSRKSHQAPKSLFEINIPYWYVKKICDTLNFKIAAAERELKELKPWIDWHDCYKINSKHLYPNIGINNSKLFFDSPYWKFRSIQVKNILQQFVFYQFSFKREEYLKKIIDSLATRTIEHKLNPVFMQAAKIKINRINCYARDLRDNDRTYRPQKWYLCASKQRRHFDFSNFIHIAKDYNKWDLAFRHCKRNLNNFRANPWEQTYFNVISGLQLLRKNSINQKGHSTIEI
ncbi:hypothetical protein LEP1GSC050_4138 [Leptospira broomii serovar Hurstbridge str. 5399]|uniref:Uncharacterized protein n=1 Tax=Leptospira broomii serovar Hurstbridge str. 5399 TaxID=1049789 RepID=T0GDN0_9LEPT|nr:hypothetical protein [Leptospira broomii]EQA44929.1 hypothetical protein LEP1GSC050_4138 [Leptospira broomii serovar Hurstbridge str. 5399]TGM09668.1 hypothetical protein EHQ86_00185 [Leptospira yasudae]